MPVDNFPYDIFVSYAGADRPFARNLVKWLRDTQVRVWMDEEQLVPGSRWRAGLQQGIRDSQHLLALLTPEYVTRSWTQREIDLFDLTANHNERRLLAVELGTIPNSPLDQIFEVTQRISWPTAEFNAGGFWCVHCGLRNIPPGPRDEWSRRGQELIGSPPPQASGAGNVTPLDYFLTQESMFVRYRGMLAIAFEAAYEPKSDLIQYYRTLRELVPPAERKALLGVAHFLWAYGFAEAAATLVIVALPNQHSDRSPWPFIDLNCQIIADWFLLGTSLQGQRVAEIWFSWAIYTKNWNLLPACAKLAPTYISKHLSFLAEAAGNRERPFATVESNFDYGTLATPWNHFHLMWLAVRLNRNDAALLHATKLCSTTSVGEVRTGRFLNRLLHWPLFDDLRKHVFSELEVARERLKLTSTAASLNFSNDIKEVWKYALARSTD